MPVLKPTTLVLDTNVVLDWLVFANPEVRPLVDAILAQRVVWVASPAMRSELERMLDHACLAHWSPNREQALACFDRHSDAVEDPEGPVPTSLRCRDADDQVFLDTALRVRARWLVTRDKALLTLARKAQGAKLRIVTPKVWASEVDEQRDHAAAAL